MRILNGNIRSRSRPPQTLHEFLASSSGSEGKMAGLLWGAVCVKIDVFSMVSHNELYNYTRHSILVYNALYNIESML